MRRQFFRRLRAFSLVEMLAVIAIVIILAVLATVGYRQVTGSRQVAAAANLVIDQLNLARQNAISKNAPVRFQICEVADSRNGDSADFRLVRLQIFDVTDRIWKSLSRSQLFPLGLIASHTGNDSTLLSSGLETISDLIIDGQSGRTASVRTIQFLPSGRTSLNPNEIHSLTIFHSRRPGDFITIQLDPISGRTRIFRP